MVKQILMKCASASIVSVAAIGLSASAASAMGGNTISNTGPGSYNVISINSTSYPSRASYEEPNSYSTTMLRCNNSLYNDWSGQSQWQKKCVTSGQSYSTPVYRQPNMMSSYSQPCDYGSTNRSNSRTYY